MDWIQKGAYVSSYAVICLICQLAFLVIRKYHQNKPPGMQTLLGKVIVLLTQVFSANMAFIEASFCLLELFGPFNATIALILWFPMISGILMVYLSFLSTMITKYLLIYHAPHMADVSEDNFLKELRILLIAFPIVATLLEWKMLSNLEELATFQMLHIGLTKSDAKLEVTMVTMILVTFSVMAAMQCRIEYDALQANDDQTGFLPVIMECYENCRNENSQQSVSGYAIKVTRIAVGLGLVLLIIIVIQMFGGADNTKWNQLFFATIMTNVMPILFIQSHPQMRKTVWKTLLKNTNFPMF